jgi:tetratricopeptide (TPR) repeat protein
MSDTVRLDELRRRIEKDPASIAFAQLAEECRRLGRHEDAVEICHNGLARHPGYLSARVTLGRALLHLGRLDEAEQELENVLRGAPQNLAALRALGDIHHRRGDLPQALSNYQAASLLAPNDPELERAVSELSEALARSASEREYLRARSVVAALEQWLAAVHVTRAQRSA